jgi:flagellar M-ring protein FliF
MAEASTLTPASALQASLKPILLLVGIAAAVAAGVTVVLWTRGPSYSLLYANIAAEDQSAIAQALDTAQIPYRIQPGSNNIEVASERVSEARMKLAGQGLPEGGGGFALMDKDPGFGVSQFMENARYQHALESELARTIANLRPVEGARVHLAIPHQTAFVRDHHPGTASVFVQVKPGRRLEEGQVQAIVNLVASSVPEMEASQVTVVDQQGRLLSSPEGHDEYAMHERQFDMVHRLEEDYTQRIESLLTPMMGVGRVRAQVVAQMDMSVSEEAHEQYRPDSQIVRSEQISEQSSRDGSGAGGVPGALTNQPPPAGVAQNPPSTAPANKTPADANAAGAANKTPAATPPATQPVAAATGVAGNDSSSSKSTTRNYEIDRTVAYTHQPPGKLKRLTVAVLLDNLRTTDKEGKVKEIPLNQQQLDHVTQLVKDAVGFDESRGDNVNVVNASFTSDAPPADGDVESPAFWESPLFLNMAKLFGGVTVLLVLVLSVLRPMVRTLIGPQRHQMQLIPRTATAGGPAGVDPVAAAAAAGGNTPALPGGQPKEVALTHEQQVAQARTLANQDAKRVAQVVRGWVAQDE